MNKDFSLFSPIVEIAENNNYIELLQRICYYDDYNANGVMLPYKDNPDEALLLANTLVNMPVQARYKVNALGEPTLGSHEVVRTPNGITFNTDSIGTHTEVYIEESEVTTVKGETKVLPCLYAKYRIWKRYENVVNAVKRLFSMNKLYSSWEISVNNFKLSNVGRILTDYEFFANTLLGYEFSTPSYGSCANGLTMVAEDIDNDATTIENALTKDIQNGRGEKMKKENILENNVEVSTEVIEENTAEQVETVEEVISEQPNEEKAEQVETEQTEQKEETYEEAETENKEDTTETNEVVEAENTVEDNIENNTECSENEKVVEENVIAEKDKKIEEVSEALVKACSKIKELETEIAELKVYKEKFELAEQERINAEREEKKNQLIDEIVRSGFVSKAEIAENEEIRNYVEALDSKSLNALIGQRFIASLNDNKKEVEVAEKVVNTKLNIDNYEEDIEDKSSCVKDYLNYLI